MENQEDEIFEGNVKPKKICIVEKGCAICGLIIFFIGLADMLIPYAIPNHKLQKNKLKYPEATFEDPKFSVVLLHFLLNGVVAFIGLLLLLASFCHNCCSCCLFGIAAFFCIPMFGLWIAQMAIDFTHIKIMRNRIIHPEYLSSMMNQNPPINSFFLYSSDLIYQVVCYKDDCRIEPFRCYSKTGVEIPIISNLTSEFIFPSDIPQPFLVRIEQEVKISDELSTNVQNIKEHVETCDVLHEKVIDNYPFITETYLVTQNKLPTSLNKKSRIASIVFGVGVYYELNYKSIPLFTFKQKSIADIAPNVNYSNIITTFDCRQLGECSLNNNKPIPQ